MECTSVAFDSSAIVIIILIPMPIKLVKTKQPAESFYNLKRQECKRRKNGETAHSDQINIRVTISDFFDDSGTVKWPQNDSSLLISLLWLSMVFMLISYRHKCRVPQQQTADRKHTQISNNEIQHSTSAPFLRHFLMLIAGNSKLHIHKIHTAKQVSTTTSANKTKTK